MAKARVTELEKDTRSITGEGSLWDLQTEKTRKSYPAWYQRCILKSRRLSAEPKTIEPGQAEGPIAKRQSPRRLDLSKCAPQKVDNSSNFVLSSYLNLQKCADTAELTEEVITAQCNSFCGDALSVRMGSPSWGVSLEESQEMCMPADGVLISNDENLAQKCSRGSTALYDIEVKTAAFIAQLDVFQAGRFVAANELPVASLPGC